MPKGRRHAKIRRPYLTTAELLASTGITRKTLRVYEDSGIVQPAYFDESEYFKYWTLEQANEIRLIQTMRRADVPVKDIAEYAQAGYADLLAGARVHTIDSLRQERRMLKAIAHRQEQLEWFAPVAGAEGCYLRYLPMRWFALIPLADQDGSFAKPGEFVTHYEALKNIVDVVGWARSFSYGTLHAFDADGRQRMRFAFMELAAPPLPVSGAKRGMDGGCYRALDPSGTCTRCDTADCVECSRFGRSPTTEELRSWKRLQDKGGHDFTLMANTPAGRRAMRIWGACVLGNNDVSENEGHGAYAITLSTEVTARPQLMPSLVRLPCGVTACILPDGTYLCRQFDDRTHAAQFKQLTTMLDGIYHVPYAGPDTRSIVRPDAFARQRPEDIGPFTEPFVNPHFVSEPALSGWNAPIAEDDLAQLALPCNMSLHPADGYLAICSRAPQDSGKGMRMEAQVLVDPGPLGPQGGTSAAAR